MDDNDDGMVALGRLICRMNPYTDAADTTTNCSTGEMEVETIPQPAPGAPAVAGTQPAPGAQAAPVVPVPAPDPIEDIIKSIAAEVANNYGEQWSFKGQMLTIKTAVRIPYRFTVTKNGGKPYWQTEYLMIGYAGGGGMG